MLRQLLREIFCLHSWSRPINSIYNFGSIYRYKICGKCGKEKRVKFKFK